VAVEIERKFLLASSEWRTEITRSIRIAQGYLGGTDCSVRIRIGDNGAFLNIKSRELGVQRLEFEYAVPEADARVMLERLCAGAAIVKTRHLVFCDEVSPIRRHGRQVCFEIDEFEGQNAGLVVAEIELSAVDQEFIKPAWLGKEVTDDARYYNSNLIDHPYLQWDQN
jgi:adenylate cyclase